MEITGVTAPYSDVNFRVQIERSTRTLVPGEAAGNLASADGVPEHLIRTRQLSTEAWVDRNAPTLDVSFSFTGSNHLGDYEVAATLRIGTRTAILPFTYHFRAGTGPSPTYNRARRVSSN